MTRRYELRRRASGLAITLAVFTLAAAGFAAGAGADEVRVLNWKGWGTDEPWAVEHFEEQTGTKVVHDYITSFPEAFTKMRTNPGYYDVIVLNQAFVAQAMNEGLIQPADTEKIPNYSNLYEEMRNSPHLNVNGETAAVAWVWGGTSVTYDTEVFDTPPTSLEVLWDPAHENRVCWRDDPEDSVRFAALALGQDPDNPSDLDAVREKLFALKPQIKAFWKSGDEWLKLVAAKECDLSTVWTNNTEAAAVQDGLPVRFIVPEEGAIAFRDGISVGADAPNEEAAHAFINYMISEEFYAGWLEVGGAPVSANRKALENLPEGSMTRQVLAQPEVIERLNFKGPLSDEQRQKYLELWQEAKAHFAQ